MQTTSNFRKEEFALKCKLQHYHGQSACILFPSLVHMFCEERCLHTCISSSLSHIMPVWTSAWHILGKRGANPDPKLLLVRNAPAAISIIPSAFKHFPVTTKTSH